MRVGGARTQPSLFLSLYFKGRGPGSLSDGVGFLLGEAPGIWGPSGGAHHSPCPVTSADVLRGAGCWVKGHGHLNADTWPRRQPRAALTPLGPLWGPAAPSRGRVATGHAHWGSGLAPLSGLGATRSVLDGALPEWTDWLSPASIQECGFEEMNIQKACSLRVLEGQEPRVTAQAGGPGSDLAAAGAPRAVLVSVGCRAPEGSFCLGLAEHTACTGEVHPVNE